MITFIGLNPSTATQNEDDQTVRKLKKYAEKWGYGGFYLVNLFALVSTNPLELFTVEDPIGEDNDFRIDQIIQKSEKVICCWGNHVRYLGRSINILSIIDEPYCLKINKNREPSHPLYLSMDLAPIKYVR